MGADFAKQNGMEPTSQEISQIIASLPPEEKLTLLKSLVADHLDIDAIIKEKYPNGMRLSPDGDVFEYRKAKKITNIQEIVEMSRATKKFHFDVNGQAVEVEINPLTDQIAAEADKMDMDLIPPKKYRVEAGKKIEDGYDFEDPKYRQKRKDAYDLKRAFIISAGVIGFGDIGRTNEEKRDWLSKNLPPRVIDALLGAVRGVTSDRIEYATFI
jgi:hypothetical protein